MERRPSALLSETRGISGKIYCNKTGFDDVLARQCGKEALFTGGKVDLFLYEVISTGMVLFTRNEDERIEIETDVLIEYQDMKYMYDLFDREYPAQV